MLSRIQNLLNTARFYLRKNLKFSRKIKKLPNERKSNIFQEQCSLIEEQNVIQKYHLQELYKDSSILQYKENLYTIKLLEDSLNNIHTNWNINDIRVLDVGSKNFSYAPGLHHFFSYFNTSDNKRNIYLDGIEIDGYRLMIDLHSRYDYAMYYTKKLSNTRYFVDNFLQFKADKYHFITIFLPFIVKEPLIKWGIPLKYLKPKELLQHACKLTHNGGIIIVVNQFEREKNIQLEIIKEMGIKYTQIEKPYNNIFSPYTLDRYITVITKE